MRAPVVIAVIALAGCHSQAAATDERHEKNETRTTTIPEKENAMETAIFGAGCFWGVEAAFRQVAGVTATEVGYCGGKTENPTYEEVCTGRTGHAEVVRVTFNPEQVSYETLLDVFWACHDPTQKNRQGPDIGTQYRSVIFHQTPAQEKAARTAMAQLQESGAYPRPIVTEITAAGPFYRAEEYHQQYLEKRGLAACHIR